MKPALEAGRAEYTPGEEVANSVIHGAGAILAIAGLTALAASASVRGTAWHVVGCSIFGATLVLLYTVSTLYHSLTPSRAKDILRILDHSAIFLLIAGTYTPFTLVNFRGPWGFSLLGAVWTMAIFGIVLRVVLWRRSTAIFVGLYLLMGWLGVVPFNLVLNGVEPGGLLLLFLGGLAYTAGIGFFAWHRLPYHHAIWHVFVLTGSALHFFAILFYVIPGAAPAS